MIAGVLIFAFGFLPLYFSGVTISTLEGAASFFAVGILVFLVGHLIRKVKKAFEPTAKGAARGQQR
jgi:hypothetical protein